MLFKQLKQIAKKINIKMNLTLPNDIFALNVIFLINQSNQLYNPMIFFLFSRFKYTVQDHHVSP